MTCGDAYIANFEVCLSSVRAASAAFVSMYIVHILQNVNVDTYFLCLSLTISCNMAQAHMHSVECAD